MVTFFRVFCRAEPLHDGTALRSQLVRKYAIAPKAAGFGIYLILWSGLNKLPRATDGGKIPTCPAELQEHLEAQLDPEERTRICVRVIDVSWPVKPTQVIIN